MEAKTYCSNMCVFNINVQKKPRLVNCMFFGFPFLLNKIHLKPYFLSFGNFHTQSNNSVRVCMCM